METVKTISIGIPTYNRSLFLKEALESIKGQLTEEVEIVVSDNGSTDDTLCMLQEYQDTLPLRVCGFKENQGIDRNIVSVIEHSTGEYIHLFGDDDILMPGTIAEILKEIKATAPAIICLNHFAFHDHSLQKRQPPFLACQRKVFRKGEEFFRYCGLGFLSSVIIRKEEALKWLHKVRFGKECAHVDIGARVALEKDAVTVYLGHVVIAGRSLKLARYHLMKSCVIYLKELYDELVQEQLLRPALHRFFIRRLLYKEIPRIAYKMLKGQEDLSASHKLLQQAFDHYAARLWIYLMMRRRQPFLMDSLFRLICSYRRIKLAALNKSDKWDPTYRPHH